MIADVHVHVGRHGDAYASPRMVVDFLRRAGVRKCAVSSLSACGGDHAGARRELEEFSAAARPDLVVAPLLWVTPSMLRSDPDLRKHLGQYPYRGLKVHGRAHPWPPDGRALHRVLAVASERSLPTLLHTGGDASCDAGAYAAAVGAHPDANVILGHGRPVDEAVEVLKENPNAWVDTAFMSPSSLRVIVAAGLGERTLFGSDIPVDRLFYKGSPLARYRAMVSHTRRIMGVPLSSLALGGTFDRLFP